MSDGRFDFSVIIPVYNVERYIEETIDSVTGQTVGFDSIQLILVNDGSRDSSGDICRRYKEKYPENIVYIDKENGGVSSARNEGLKHAEGRYINFLDSDDLWSRDAFEHALKFFDDNPDVRIATGRFVFFGRKTGRHYLDYKYAETRTVDITEEYEYPEFSVSKSFFRRDLLEGELFDERVAVSEDCLYINRLIMREHRYGLIREADYYYRKRDDASSAIDNSTKNMGWYTTTINEVFGALIDYSIELTGEVMPYLQYLLMSDLQWRIIEKMPESFSGEESAGYIKALRDVLAHVDDTIIAEHRAIREWIRIYAFRLKYRDSDEDTLAQAMLPLSQKSRAAINIMTIDDSIRISGEALERYYDREAEVYAKDQNGSLFRMEYKEHPVFDRGGIDESIVLKCYMHHAELPLYDGASYSFFVKDGKGNTRDLKLSFGEFSPLSRYKHSFFERKGFIIYRKKEVLTVEKKSLKEHIRHVRRCNATIEKEAGEEILRLRAEGLTLKRRSRKPIWIVSDRSNFAGDNGEALFRHLMENGYGKKYDIRFLLEKDSPDFERISRIGKVLEHGSREHLVTQLAASKIISSAGDNWVFNPYDLDWKYLKDILDYKYVFLQHGIIVGDLSPWLQILRKNIKLFCTSAVPEYESILKDSYGYDSEVVKLTGLARFDRLTDEKEKVISFLPTWRKEMMPDSINLTSRRIYSEAFKYSEYFRFYNSLINDKAVCDAMRENGYTGTFYLHPSLIEQHADFEGNDVISVCDTAAPYNEIFKKSALMVTDYSSAAMDFAYLRKPVIYAQFDREAFYAGHAGKEGYYDFERDGFGPVCYSYEDTVRTILDMIGNGCEEDAKYRERADRFFPFNDRKNCERIIAEIEKL